MRKVHVMPLSVGVVAGKRRRTIDAEFSTIRQAFSAQPWLRDEETTLAIVGGAEWPSDRWDVDLPPGLDVVFSPRIALDVVAAFVVAIAASVISYQLAKEAALAALRKQDETDESSASSSWRQAQSTRIGRGWSIPVAVGEPRCAGQLIGFSEEPGPANDELVSLLVALSEGPIHSIGGLTGGTNGEADELGSIDGNTNARPIPSGLRLDGVTLTKEQAVVSLRMGTTRQSRLPRWPQATGTLSPGGELNEFLDIVVVTIDQALLDVVRVAVEFPGGLYQIVGGQRQAYSVTINLSIRRVGETAWPPGTNIIESGPRGTGFIAYGTVIPLAPRLGPYEIRIQRRTQSGNSADIVSQCRVAHVSYDLFQTLTHPGLALISVTTRTSSSAAQKPELSVPVRGILVRGWAAFGAAVWTAPTWLSTAPWSHPLGRNPAFIALQLLTDRDYGLASELLVALGGDGTEEVDVWAFRRWADNCDRDDPAIPGEAIYTCDHVFDVSRPALEQLLVVFKCGLAVPVRVGGKLTVHYEYRDAHGRGTVSVPAREPYQVIASSNCRDFRLWFKDPLRVANIVECEFLNSAQDDAPDFARVQDNDRIIAPFAGAAPRLVASRFSMPGVRHIKRARRHAWHTLQWLGKSLAEGSFTLGLQAVSFTVGDLFILQHEAWYPDATHPTGSMRNKTTGASVGAIQLDRPIQNDVARTDKVLFVAETNGRLKLCTINGTGLYNAGDFVPLWDPQAGAAASVTVEDGATVAWGTWGIFEHVMLCTSIKEAPNVSAVIEFRSWPAEAFDEPPPEVMEDSGTVEDLGDDEPPAQPAPTSAPAPQPTPVRVAAAGRLELSPPQTLTGAALTSPGRSRAVQHWLRPTGGTYRMVAAGRAQVADVSDLPADAEYQIATVEQARGGRGFAAPEGSAAPATVWLPELAGPYLPAPEGLTAAAAYDATVVSWRPVRGAAAYFVCRGAGTVGAPRLWSGQDAACRLVLGPGTHRLRVAAVGASGRVGRSAALSVAVPERLASLASDTSTTFPGTHDRTEVVSSTLRLVAGACRGQYTAELMLSGGPAAVTWSALVDWTGRHARPIVEFFEGGQIARCTGVPIAGRHPSPLHPGAENVPIADLGTIAEWHRLRRTSGLGAFVAVDLEARWHDGSTWSAWAPCSGAPSLVLAERLQVRATLRRASPAWTLIVDRLELRASA